MLMKKKPNTKGRKKKDPITVEMKEEITKKHENGIRVIDITRHFNKSASTIYTFLKNKEKLIDLDTAKGVNR